MIGRFKGREILSNPACPFCGLLIERPKELATRMPHEMPLGTCLCGAVYAFDATGHNLGAAMIDALVFGCNGDWNLAWDLLPEEDYEEARLSHYDLVTHRVIHGGVYEGRRIAGTLYFIRLHGDIREVTEPGVRQRMKTALPATSATSAPKEKGKRLSKDEIACLVEGYDPERVIHAALQDRRTLRYLQRLLYSPDKLLRMKTADLLGKACRAVAHDDPGSISRMLQAFFTSLTDSAASCWGSLDAIGEIIRNAPEQFAGYVSQLYPLAKDRALLPDVLSALHRIAEKRPELVRKMTYPCILLLSEPECEIRARAALLLGTLRAAEAKEGLERLLDDPWELDIYGSGTMEKKGIGQIASEAISGL